MSCASDELVLIMTDTIMLLVSHVNYPVIGTKAVSMNCRREFNFTANNGLNAGLFAIRDDLRVDTTIALINSKDDSLASRPATALASDSSSAEVRFIKFNVARKRRLALTMLSNGLANQSQITVNSIAIQSSQSADLGSSQIERKELQKLSK